MRLPTSPQGWVLLGLGALLLLIVLWIVVSSYLEGLIALAVGAVIGYALYRFWVSGKFEELYHDMRANPRKYIPIAVFLLFLGGYIAYQAQLVPVLDLSISLTYKLKPGKGIAGALVGAEIDVNTVEYEVGVLRAYYDLPWVVITKAKNSEESPGTGYYFRLRVPETGEEYYFPMHGASVVARYVSGESGDIFYIYGLKLRPDYDYHVLELSILYNGRAVWSTEVFIVPESGGVGVIDRAMIPS